MSARHLSSTLPITRILSFDRQRGTVEVEAGIQGPALHAYLRDEQPEDKPAWGIRQKQTGADRLSLGGALSANVHGRGGLEDFAPFARFVVRGLAAAG